MGEQLNAKPNIKKGRPMIRFVLSLTLAFAGLASAYGFESTTVLPEGIRNLSVTNITTSLNKKRNEHGSFEPLAEKLWKPLRFKNVIAGESGLKKLQLESLLLIEPDFNGETTLGDFTADVHGNLSVTAPIFAYGITDRLTLAVAIPYYVVNSDISIGFKPNRNADAFIASLADQKTSNTAAAREVAGKFNRAVGRLNEKLERNGYQTFGEWSEQGVGDMTVAAKYLAYNSDPLKVAFTTGLVLPTGRIDDPDIFTDLPFGDGQTDIFAAVTVDEPFANGFVLNQFAKYTRQLPGRRPVRWKTEDELIEVDTKDTRFDLGDKVELAVSLQFKGQEGFIAGIGGLAQQKFGDRYLVSDPEVAKELERETDSKVLYGLAQVGYSTVPAFRRGEFPAPLMISFQYRKHYGGMNTPVTNLSQLDFKVFF